MHRHDPRALLVQLVSELFRQQRLRAPDLRPLHGRRDLSVLFEGLLHQLRHRPHRRRIADGPVLSAIFCVAGTGQSAVDGTAGLPGAGAIRQPSSVVDTGL